VDELQQWHAAARAAAGMWAVVGLLLLLLALHVTTAPYVEQWLPSLLRLVPTMLYAGLVPVLSRYALRPVCRWLNSLEKHSTKVNHCSNLVSPDFLLYRTGKGTLPVIVANVVCVMLSPSTLRTGSGFTVSAKRWFVAWRFCAALPSIYYPMSRTSVAVPRGDEPGAEAVCTKPSQLPVRARLLRPVRYRHHCAPRW
jgi:hypothetical protein